MVNKYRLERNQKALNDFIRFMDFGNKTQFSITFYREKQKEVTTIYSEKTKRAIYMSVEIVEIRGLIIKYVFNVFYDSFRQDLFEIKNFVNKTIEIATISSDPEISKFNRKEEK